MHPIQIEDYQGNIALVTDVTGCSLMPTSYILGKALEYCDLLTDNSTKRARFKE